MKIRKAKKQDIPALNSLSDELHLHMAKCYGINISKKDLEEEHYSLKDFKNDNVYVAEINKRIVGCISFGKKVMYDEWKGKYIELYHIFVDAKYRKLGIGQKLLDIIMNMAKKKKASIKADTGFTNKSAIAFYNKNGFKPLNLELVWKLK